jgi:ferritin-like metal-binding protein YciE
VTKKQDLTPFCDGYGSMHEVMLTISDAKDAAERMVEEMQEAGLKARRQRQLCQAIDKLLKRAEELYEEMEGSGEE